MVTRFVVERRMGEGARILRSTLVPGDGTFYDELGEWTAEEEVLIDRDDYREKLHVANEGPGWDELRENRVFLWGSFELAYEGGKAKRFERTTGLRRWMRIDTLPFVKAVHEQEYSKLLTRDSIVAHVGKDVRDRDVIIHVLNVGHGDTIIIEFPTDHRGLRRYGVVDCYDYEKFDAYMRRLHEVRNGDPKLLFMCATHPHRDHILGIPRLLRDGNYLPEEFWDSGFRMAANEYREILHALDERKIPLVRVTAGMERYVGSVRITALAPSILLRNTYDTYGVDANNASIVLRLENHRSGNAMIAESDRYQAKHEVIGHDEDGKAITKPIPFDDPELVRDSAKGVVILGGDAEFDSWARINQEFPYKKVEDRSEHEPLVVKKVLNMLKCQAIKVSHHGSMHSIPLEIFERMSPKYAVISTRQRLSKRKDWPHALYPHPATVDALKEIKAEVHTTDGSYERENDCREGGNAQPGHGGDRGAAQGQRADQEAGRHRPGTAPLRGAGHDLSCHSVTRSFVMDLSPSTREEETATQIPESRQGSAICATVMISGLGTTQGGVRSSCGQFPLMEPVVRGH